MDNSRTRHLNLVPSTPRAGADTGGDAKHSVRSGHWAPSRNPIPPAQDVVVSGQSGTNSYTISVHGTTDFQLVVPHLDQPPLATPPRSSKETQAGHTEQRSVHHLPRLWRLLLGSNLSRSLRIGVLDPRSERPVSRHLPDGFQRASDLRDDRVRDRVRADRRSAQLFRGLRLGTLVLRIGPAKSW